MLGISPSSRWSDSSDSCPHGKGGGLQKLVLTRGHIRFSQTRGAAYTHGDFHSRQVSSMAHQFTGHYLLVSLPCGDEAVHSRSPSLSVHIHATLGFQAREGFGYCSSRWSARSGLELPGVSRFPRESALEQDVGASQKTH